MAPGHDSVEAFLRARGSAIIGSQLANQFASTRPADFTGKLLDVLESDARFQVQRGEAMVEMRKAPQIKVNVTPAMNSKGASTVR